MFNFDFNLFNPYFLLAYLLILAGLAGTVIPVVPGPTLIWLGMFVWAWADGFATIGWVTLSILGVCALVSWSLDFVLTPMMSRRAGVSWRAILGGIVGGMLGGAFLTFIPILGTIAGAMIGAVLGMWIVEYNIKGNADAAGAAVKTYVLSMLLNTGIEVALALFMVGFFVWQIV